MGVDDIRSKRPIQPVQVANGVEVGPWADRMDQAVHADQPDPVTDSLGPDRVGAGAMDQRHPVAAGRLVETGGDRIFLGTAQQQPGDDMDDGERPNRRRFRRPSPR